MKVNQATRYEQVVVEDLNVAGMEPEGYPTKPGDPRRLARSPFDRALGELRRQLGYKTSRQGAGSSSPTDSFPAPRPARPVGW
jgi:hypothetical protein